MSIKQKTLSVILTCTTIVSATTVNAESSHGISLAVSAISNVDVEGVHSRAPASGFELMKIGNGKINSINSIGYSYRYSNAESSRWRLDLGLTYGKATLPPQTALLTYTGGTTSVVQPIAWMESGEFYLGGIYEINNFGSPFYIGAGASYIKGTAIRTSYVAGTPSAYGTYGTSGLEGYKVSAKAGFDYGNYSIEVEQGQYNVHIKQYRSFNISGADIKYNNTTLRIIYRF